jgi:hypothetical protein
MASGRSEGGWRLLWPPNSPNAHSTLVYVVDHARKGGYRFTIVSPTAIKTVGQGAWFGELKPRSQGIDPPSSWPDAWAAYQEQGPEAVQRIIREIDRRAKEHAEKNRFVAEVQT